ncbi:MAG: hypothetical protein SFT81_04625 [Candidatus Caenarcaniphilales bacterium]|nr:hypothetical protein [Candidatus Caenarcaniphilales bacterium]
MVRAIGPSENSSDSIKVSQLKPYPKSNTDTGSVQVNRIELALGLLAKPLIAGFSDGKPEVREGKSLQDLIVRSMRRVSNIEVTYNPELELFRLLKKYPEEVVKLLNGLNESGKKKVIDGTEYVSVVSREGEQSWVDSSFLKIEDGRCVHGFAPLADGIPEKSLAWQAVYGLNHDLFNPEGFYNAVSALFDNQPKGKGIPGSTRGNHDFINLPGSSAVVLDKTESGDVLRIFTGKNTSNEGRGSGAESRHTVSEPRVVLEINFGDLGGHVSKESLVKNIHLLFEQKKTWEAGLHENIVANFILGKLLTEISQFEAPQISNSEVIKGICKSVSSISKDAFTEAFYKNSDHVMNALHSQKSKLEKDIKMSFERLKTIGENNPEGKELSKSLSGKVRELDKKKRIGDTPQSDKDEISNQIKVLHDQLIELAKKTPTGVTLSSEIEVKEKAIQTLQEQIDLGTDLLKYIDGFRITIATSRANNITSDIHDNSRSAESPYLGVFTAEFTVEKNLDGKVTTKAPKHTGTDFFLTVSGKDHKKASNETRQATIVTVGKYNPGNDSLSGLTEKMAYERSFAKGDANNDTVSPVSISFPPTSAFGDIETGKIGNKLDKDGILTDPYTLENFVNPDMKEFTKLSTEQLQRKVVAIEAEIASLNTELNASTKALNETLEAYKNAKQTAMKTGKYGFLSLQAAYDLGNQLENINWLPFLKGFGKKMKNDAEQKAQTLVPSEIKTRLKDIESENSVRANRNRTQITKLNNSKSNAQLLSNTLQSVNALKSAIEKSTQAAWKAPEVVQAKSLPESTTAHVAQDNHSAPSNKNTFRATAGFGTSSIGKDGYSRKPHEKVNMAEVFYNPDNQPVAISYRGITYKALQGFVGLFYIETKERTVVYVDFELNNWSEFTDSNQYGGYVSFHRVSNLGETLYRDAEGRVWKENPNKKTITYLDEASRITWGRDQAGNLYRKLPDEKGFTRYNPPNQ